MLFKCWELLDWLSDVSLIREIMFHGVNFVLEFLDVFFCCCSACADFSRRGANSGQGSCLLLRSGLVLYSLYFCLSFFLRGDRARPTNRKFYLRKFEPDFSEILYWMLGSVCCRTVLILV
jgi:hypothetical protein